MNGKTLGAAGAILCLSVGVLSGCPGEEETGAGAPAKKPAGTTATLAPGATPTPLQGTPASGPAGAVQIIAPTTEPVKSAPPTPTPTPTQLPLVTPVPAGGASATPTAAPTEFVNPGGPGGLQGSGTPQPWTP